MKRFPSIKRNEDFKKVYMNRRSFAAGNLVMYVCDNHLAINRLGISCSKKIGNSVVRHTFSRKIREIFRLNTYLLDNGLDIVIIARKGAGNTSYREFERNFFSLCKKHQILNLDFTEEAEKQNRSSEEEPV